MARQLPAHDIHPVSLLRNRRHIRKHRRIFIPRLRNRADGDPKEADQEKRQELLKRAISGLQE